MFCGVVFTVEPCKLFKTIYQTHKQKKTGPNVVRFFPRCAHVVRAAHDARATRIVHFSQSFFHGFSFAVNTIQISVVCQAGSCVFSFCCFQCCAHVVRALRVARAAHVPRAARVVRGMW